MIVFRILFFQIIEKRSLTISDLPYISGDLVDVTKAKTIEKEDITQISSLLDVISSIHSSSPLVGGFHICFCN